jgi:hypothetical protein
MAKFKQTAKQEAELQAQLLCNEQVKAQTALMDKKARLIENLAILAQAAAGWLQSRKPT